jgi:hypothetical protein
LQEKHPEVWHKVARNAIVWIVEQYFHLPSPVLLPRAFSFVLNCAKGQKEEWKDSIQVSKQANRFAPAL